MHIDCPQRLEFEFPLRTQCTFQCGTKCFLIKTLIECCGNLVFINQNRSGSINTCAMDSKIWCEAIEISAGI